MYKLFIFIFFIISTCLQAHAGPFGTNMGDKPDQFTYLIPLGINKDDNIITYKTHKIPKSYPIFTEYELSFIPDDNSPNNEKLSSLSIVVAKSERLKDLEYTNNEFKKIIHQLEMKYGTGIKTKPLPNSSNNREYLDEYKWNIKTNPIDNVVYIFLSLRKDNDIYENRYVISLSFVYKNFLENLNKIKYPYANSF